MPDSATARNGVNRAHIRRVLSRADRVGVSTCLLASKLDARLPAVRAALREMDGAESHGSPGLGGAQWRLKAEVAASD